MAVVGTDLGRLEEFKDKMFTFITFSSPHVGASSARPKLWAAGPGDGASECFTPWPDQAIS